MRARGLGVGGWGSGLGQKERDTQGAYERGTEPDEDLDPMT